MPIGYRIPFILLSYLYFCVVVLFFFAYGPTKYEYFFTKSTELTDGTLTGTSTLDQSEHRSNDNEDIHPKSNN